MFVPEDHGTSHLTIIDKEGNAVALTSTINTYFGSGVMSASTGGGDAEHGGYGCTMVLTVCSYCEILQPLHPCFVYVCVGVRIYVLMYGRS